MRDTDTDLRKLVEVPILARFFSLMEILREKGCTADAAAQVASELIRLPEVRPSVGGNSSSSGSGSRQGEFSRRLAAHIEAGMTTGQARPLVEAEMGISRATAYRYLRRHEEQEEARRREEKAARNPFAGFRPSAEQRV